jgi:hypothetical protein
MFTSQLSQDQPSQQTKQGHRFKARNKSAFILFRNIMLSFFRKYQLASKRKQKTNVVLQVMKLHDYLHAYVCIASAVFINHD